MMLFNGYSGMGGGVNRKQSMAWLVFTGYLSSLPNKIKENT